jgi:hypothetical protein
MAGLTVLTTRNQLIDVNQTVQLTVEFKDMYGNPIMLDAFPTISIVSPSGLVISAPTSGGVMQLDVGKYQFNFTTPFDGPYGIWNDVWIGSWNGNQVTTSLEFVVVHTDLPALNVDGYTRLGDDPGFHYSQTAIRNINKLMKSLRSRLNSSGKAKSTDTYGNVIYVDCDIFSVDMLTSFIANAITDFNQVPYFTFFTFEDTIFLDIWHDIIVEGATLMALASQALIERGREFQITDNGVNFNPPTISELLNTQYTTLLSNYYDKLKYIKNSMRPAPKGLGTLRPLSSSPQFMRLRHLRARQVI